VLSALQGVHHAQHLILTPSPPSERSQPYGAAGIIQGLIRTSRQCVLHDSTMSGSVQRYTIILSCIKSQAGPPGIPVLKFTNSRSSLGKIPTIPV